MKRQRLRQVREFTPKIREQVTTDPSFECRSVLLQGLYSHRLCCLSNTKYMYLNTQDTKINKKLAIFNFKKLRNRWDSCDL